MIIFVSLFLSMSFARATDYTQAQAYTGQMWGAGPMGILHVDANGNIMRPDSGIPFTPIDGTNSGFESQYVRLVKVPGSESEYYINMPKEGMLGSASMMEINKKTGAIEKTSDCSGNYGPRNPDGVYCMTMTPDTCSSFLRNFVSNENPIIKNSLAGLEKAKSGLKLTEFQQKLNECSDAMSRFATADAPYSLDPKHRSLLYDTAKQSYPIHSVNETNFKLQSGIQIMREKMKIFDLCKSLLEADQKQSGRGNFLRPAEKSTVR